MFNKVYNNNFSNYSSNENGNKISVGLKNTAIYLYKL